MRTRQPQPNYAPLKTYRPIYPKIIIIIIIIIIIKKDSQCPYNALLWCVHATTVATETQRCLCALLSYNVTVKNAEIQTIAQKCFFWCTYVAGNNKTYTHRHVKHPIFLYNIKKIWSFSTDFHTIPHIKFRENLFSGSRTDTCRQKDGNDKANRRFLRLSERA